MKPFVNGRGRRLGPLCEAICGVMEAALLYGIDQVIFAANRTLLPLALNCTGKPGHGGPRGPTKKARGNRSRDAGHPSRLERRSGPLSRRARNNDPEKPVWILYSPIWGPSTRRKTVSPLRLLSAR
jgi:hypothetical protein